LRVRTKRLRYALETLRSLGDRSTRELLGRLEGLQDTLGKGQDAVTAIDWLRELAATRGVPASALPPAGALIQALARRVQKLRAAAAGMRALGLTFDAILTSPLVRAAETAAIVAEAQGSQAAPRELSALEPGVPPVETVGALRAFARHEHVAIVGHEPSLSGVVAFLLTGSPDGLRLVLKKGGLVALEVRDPGRGRGATLRCMLTPRQLRRLGR